MTDPVALDKARFRPKLPAEAPKSSYEFNRVWRGLKRHQDLRGEYLQVLVTCRAAQQPPLRAAGQCPFARMPC